METVFPKFYKEKIEQRVKQEEILNQQGIELGRTGPTKLEYAPPHLYPQQGIVKYSMASLGQVAAEIPEDVLRAKYNYVRVPQPRFNQYTSQPTPIALQHRFKLIEDPIDYEMEYKKRNIWSLKDLKTFIVGLLKGPKRFEKIG